MLKYKFEDFCDEYGYSKEDFVEDESKYDEPLEPKYVYVSEDDENPFLGVGYGFGLYEIVGLGLDRFVTYQEMRHALRKGVR